jgi:RpiR family carbohydrate utilization transcriptional regulator
VVAISNSGRSRDLIEVVEVVLRKGATLIVITASGSPLAPWPNRMARRAGGRPPEDYDRYSPMVSRLLHLTIVDILTTGVALRLGQALRPTLQEIKRNLRLRRYTAED